MNLAPQHLSVAKLLDGRLFRIPNYQRGYSWQKKHRKDLFHDIEEAHKSGREHFMATIVSLAGEKISIMADEFQTSEIVDGQQRITTLVILIKAIEKRLVHAQHVDLKSDVSRLLVKGDEYSLLLLQTNHDSSNIFAEFMKTGKIDEGLKKTASDQNVIDAARECERFVDGWCNQRSEDPDAIVKLLSTVRNRLSVIYHEIADEAMVYRVFEVLNSRGLDVRWMDKTKSQLMSLIFENVGEQTRSQGLNDMKVIWQKIYQTLGLDVHLDSEALRFAGTFLLTSQPSRVLSEDEAHSTLCDYSGTKISQIMSSTDHLFKVVRLVKELNDDKRKSAVTKIVHARFLAVAIMLRDFESSIQEELLQLWEKVTFRIFGLGRGDSRMEVGNYVRLAFDVYSNSLQADEILVRIRGLGGKDYSIDRVLSNPNVWSNCYVGWTEELRYLLFRYDEDLSKKAGERINLFHWGKIWNENPVNSIEHIVPQSSSPEFKHHIGNLTMLPCGVNSKLRDDPPSDKAATYMTSGLRDAINVGCAIQKDAGWGEPQVIARADLIEEFVRREWGD